MTFCIILYTNLFVNYSSVKLERKFKEFISSIKKKNPQVIAICKKFWDLWLSAGQHLFFSRKNKPLKAFIQPMFFSFLCKATIFLLVAFKLVFWTFKNIIHRFSSPKRFSPRGRTNPFKLYASWPPQWWVYIRRGWKLESSCHLIYPVRTCGTACKSEPSRKWLITRTHAASLATYLEKAAIATAPGSVPSSIPSLKIFFSSGRFWVSDLYHFPSLWRASLTISCKADLSATDSLNFCVRTTFVSPSVLKDTFVGYKKCFKASTRHVSGHWKHLHEQNKQKRLPLWNLHPSKDNK